MRWTDGSPRTLAAVCGYTIPLRMHKEARRTDRAFEPQGGEGRACRRAGTPRQGRGFLDRRDVRFGQAQGNQRFIRPCGRRPRIAHHRAGDAAEFARAGHASGSAGTSSSSCSTIPIATSWTALVTGVLERLKRTEGAAPSPLFAGVQFRLFQGDAGVWDDGDRGALKS